MPWTGLDIRASAEVSSESPPKAHRPNNNPNPREHIFRNHKRSGSSCPRCRVVFDTDRLLALHLQEETPCELKKPLHEDEVLFITQEQERQLKKRTRNTVNEERWIKVFQVVFPDVPIDRIPSPCKSKL